MSIDLAISETSCSAGPSEAKPIEHGSIPNETENKDKKRKAVTPAMFTPMKKTLDKDFKPPPPPPGVFM